MKAVSHTKYRIIVEAPPGATRHELEVKARKYIKRKFKIIEDVNRKM